MYWPQASDYREAIQNPVISFRAPELSGGQAVNNALGLPLTWTGNFAAVFHVRGTTSQQDWAIKCFTKDKPGLQERYRQIAAHLQRQRLPFMVDFRFSPEEVLVRGQRYPVLRMDWVEGRQLDQFLADCLTQPNYKSTLRMLSGMWVKLAQRLRQAQVAHGDLQHGNVLLVPVPEKEAFNLRLVDYDGICVPGLEHVPSHEVGHPAFQHPQRIAEGGHGLDIDRFSHLLIYTTLQCLIAGGRKLWDQFYDGDRLLLGPLDLLEPERSRVFGELWKLEDPAVESAVGHLLLAIKGDLADVRQLDEVAVEGGVVPLTDAQRRAVESWVSRSNRRGAPAARTAAASVQRSPAPIGSAQQPAAGATVPVVVTCRCGQRFAAASYLWGKQVACPACGGPLDVPPPPNAAAGISELRLLAPDAEWWATASPVTRPQGSRIRRLSSSPRRRGPPDFDDWLQQHGRAVRLACSGVFVLAIVLMLLPWAWHELKKSLQQASGPQAASIVESEPTDLQADPNRPPLAVAPFDVTGAKQHQMRWAAYRGRPVQISNSLGMAFVCIPPGQFMMGASASDDSARSEEQPQHLVRITRPFYLGAHEVRQVDFEHVMGNNPSRLVLIRRSTGSFSPQDSVTWEEAVEFCRKLNGLSAEQAAGRSYRLPTEAEWEHACRAGTSASFYVGQQLTKTAANVLGSLPNQSTSNVGSYPPNAFGLYDMYGNVWEFCQDRYDRRFYTYSPRDDPHGPSEGTSRVVRGGCFRSESADCRSARRDGRSPSSRDFNTGFRLVCELTGPGSGTNPPVPTEKNERTRERDADVPTTETQPVEASDDGRDSESHPAAEPTAPPSKMPPESSSPSATGSQDMESRAAPDSSDVVPAPPWTADGQKADADVTTDSNHLMPAPTPDSHEVKAEGDHWTNWLGNTIAKRAQFVRVHDKAVVILSGARVLTVPIVELSAENEEYVRRELRRTGQERALAYLPPPPRIWTIPLDWRYRFKTIRQDGTVVARYLGTSSVEYRWAWVSGVQLREFGSVDIPAIPLKLFGEADQEYVRIQIRTEGSSGTQ